MGVYSVHPTLKPLIDQLVKKRKELKWRQLDLDVRTGWANGLTGKYECGMRSPTLVALAMWARALDCDIVIDSDDIPQALSPHSSKTAISLLETHKCSLKLTESRVQFESALKRTEENLEQIRASSVQLTKAIELASNQPVKIAAPVKQKHTSAATAKQGN